MRAATPIRVRAPGVTVDLPSMRAAARAFGWHVCSVERLLDDGEVDRLVQPERRRSVPREHSLFGRPRTTMEVAALLRVSPETVRCWARSGRMSECAANRVSVLAGLVEAGRPLPEPPVERPVPRQRRRANGLRPLRLDPNEFDPFSHGYGAAS